jgi:polar amino acid transport system permease protein
MLSDMRSALPFLGAGLVTTLWVSLAAVIGSLILGVPGGIVLVHGRLILRLPFRIYADLIRGIPALVLIFGFYYGLPAAGVQLPGVAAAVLALVFYKAAQVIEITRGAVASIAPGQIDAGRALGLTFGQVLRRVVLPQALAQFLPPWLNAVVDTVKASALVSLVGVIDLMMAIQQVIGRTFRPMPLYLLGAAIYIAINMSLSVASRVLERRLRIAGPT